MLKDQKIRWSESWITASKIDRKLCIRSIVRVWIDRIRSTGENSDQSIDSAKVYNQKPDKQAKT